MLGFCAIMMHYLGHKITIILLNMQKRSYLCGNKYTYRMKSTPHCKINIGLNVVAKRPDGYHNLETIFYPIPLCDELQMEEDVEDSLCVDGIALDGQWQDNLVMKAVYALRHAGHAIPPLRITLKKNIPCGAGLGGGSSDAAFAMMMLNKEYRLGLSGEQMEQLLAPLGADCPFFVRTEPFYATGIGNVFSPTPLSLKGWHLVLVKPDDHISTKEAYAGIVPQPAAYALTEIANWSMEEWRGRVVNDFEQSVFPNHPTVANIKEQLYQMGASYASMSGSGSSVFGLFKSMPENVQETFSKHFVFQTTL